MFLIYCFVCITTYVNLVSTESTYCGNWDEFGEQNCIKIIDKEKLVNYENAVEMCSQTENSHLIKINSENEQKFIENYLFKDKQIVDNVWIGLRNENGFKWSDKSSVNYTNWADKSPINNTDRFCVQISTDTPLPGKWVNENCNKKAVVICEKIIDYKKLFRQKDLDYKIIFEKNKSLQKEIEELKLKNCKSNPDLSENLLISRIKQFHSHYNISKPFIDFDNKQRVLFTVWNNSYDYGNENIFNLCEPMDSNKIEIRSKQKQEIVGKIIVEWGLENNNFWLNGKRDSSLKWRWNSDGTEFNYTNWNTGYPKLTQNYDLIRTCYHCTDNFEWANCPVLFGGYIICEHRLNI